MDPVVVATPVPIEIKIRNVVGALILGEREREAAAKAPTAADLQKGDPGGTITGTIADVTVTDAKAGPTLADAGNQIGQNKVAINFVILSIPF